MGKIKIENLKDKIEFLQNNLVRNEKTYLEENSEDMQNILTSMVVEDDKHWYRFEDDCEDIVIAEPVYDYDDSEGVKEVVQFVLRLDDKLYSFKIMFYMWEYRPIELGYITWLGEVKPKEIIIKKTVYEEV